MDELDGGDGSRTTWMVETVHGGLGGHEGNCCVLRMDHVDLLESTMKGEEEEGKEEGDEEEGDEEEGGEQEVKFISLQVWLLTG